MSTVLFWIALLAGTLLPSSGAPCPVCQHRRGPRRTEPMIMQGLTPGTVTAYQRAVSIFLEWL